MYGFNKFLLLCKNIVEVYIDNIFYTPLTIMIA